MINKYITNWIPAAEAQMLRLKYIVEGKYQKHQIQLSSRRWADPNDHSKGYLARVHVEGGIHPELELGDTGKRVAAVKTEQSPIGTWNTEQVTGSLHYETEESRIYYKRNQVDEVKSA